MSTKAKWEFYSFLFIFGLIVISSHFMSVWVAIPIAIANVFGYAEGKLKPTEE